MEWREPHVNVRAWGSSVFFAEGTWRYIGPGVRAVHL